VKEFFTVHKFVKFSQQKIRALVDPALEFHMVGEKIWETSCVMRGELRVTGNVPTCLI
jgi:hypothetical protein